MLRRIVSSPAVRATLARSLLPRAVTQLRSSSVLPPMSGATRGFQERSLSSEATQNLADMLEREHAEEMDNSSTTLPSDLKKLMATLENEEGWKIVDDGAMTKLYLSIGASKVQVSFHCQDTVEMESYFESSDEDFPEDASPVKFTVSVTKAGKSLAMTCITTEDLSVKIQSIATTTDLDVDGNILPVKAYQGPEFTELAEDLQDSFHQYLIDDIGIQENLISFISMYCDYKEQKEYVHFLEDAKSLL